MATPYQPAPYTAGDGPFEFIKDDGVVYEMSREVYDALWQRGCVEVNNIPRENLSNVIHPIFRKAAMISLNAEEYAAIEPALKLASRFITERHYLEFWVRLATARTRNDRDDGSFLVEDETANAAQAAIDVDNAFAEIAGNLQFSIMSERLTDNLTTGCQAAESWTDRHHLGHRYWQEAEAIEGQCPADNNCAKCVGIRLNRCYSCGDHYYRDPDADLPDTFRRGGIASRNLETAEREELIEELEDLDEAEDGIRPQPVSGRRRNNDNLNNMYVGLRHDVFRHIRQRVAGRAWSESQEVRFQFAVASTLVHELAHIFWWWTRRVCMHCEGDEPRWSRRSNDEPELGKAWELWALGSHVPTVGKTRAAGAVDATPNIFSRSDWSYTQRTEQGGTSSKIVCVKHDFIFPVEWINAWFREETWDNIATNGRLQGRPSHDNLVLLHEQGTRMGNDGRGRRDHITRYECELEDYSHVQLVERRGFDRGAKINLYAKSGLAKAFSEGNYMQRLRDERDERRRQRAEERRRAKRAHRSRRRSVH